MEKFDEIRLIRAVLKGDAESFEPLVRDNERHVYGLCLKLMGNPADAEDAAQEAFLRAYTALDTFTGQSKFSVWLYRITYNVCLDLLRKQKRQATVPLETEDGQLLQLPDPAPTPEETALRTDEQRRIWGAVNALPEKYAQVLLLRGAEGRSYDEIAAILGVETGTVKSRLSRARAMLEENLRGDGTFSDALRLKSKRGGEAR